jgi:septum formation protein
MIKKPIILASSSPARRLLIEKLGIPFECASPDVDETPLLGETAKQLVQRLALKKAQKIAANFPDHLIIGCDQVAELSGQIYGKPLTHQRATTVLQNFSNQTVIFHSGICLLNATNGQYQRAAEPFYVTFKALSADQIEHYLLTDQPYHCAGSLKVESLGRSLIAHMEGRDMNGLIGLPILKLRDMLANSDADDNDKN